MDIFLQICGSSPGFGHWIVQHHSSRCVTKGLWNKRVKPATGCLWACELARGAVEQSAGEQAEVTDRYYKILEIFHNHKNYKNTINQTLAILYGWFFLIEVNLKSEKTVSKHLRNRKCGDRGQKKHALKIGYFQCLWTPDVSHSSLWVTQGLWDKCAKPATSCQGACELAWGAVEQSVGEQAGVTDRYTKNYRFNLKVVNQLGHF